MSSISVDVNGDREVTTHPAVESKTIGAAGNGKKLSAADLPGGMSGTRSGDHTLDAHLDVERTSSGKAIYITKDTVEEVGNTADAALWLLDRCPACAKALLATGDARFELSPVDHRATWSFRSHGEQVLFPDGSIVDLASQTSYWSVEAFVAATAGAL